MISLVVDTKSAFGVLKRDMPDGKSVVVVLAREDLAPLTRTSVFPPQPGQWWLDQARRAVVVGCPGCGSLLSVQLGETHEVEDDGCMRPSLFDPQAKCPFHAWVRLDGWTGSGPKLEVVR